MNEPAAPTIELDQFLKICGVATGGQAKRLIQSGEVLVNAQLELRRRRKLVAGDQVQIGGEIFVVDDANEPESAESDEQMDNFPCIDIGANLTHKSFDKDFDQVVAEARAAGVSNIILTGACQSSSERSSAHCQRHPGFFYSTAGVHPHDAKSFDDSVKSAIESLLGHEHVVAIGECGLDFNRDFSPREDQRNCFDEHLKMATTFRKPLFLHERDAHPEFLEMMRHYRSSIQDAVVHCFTGTGEALRAYLDLDLHIGITGWICDERRGTHLRKLVSDIPANRLMIETDSPYLAPRDIRPKVHRNEPKYLPHILKHVAECRSEDPWQLAGQIQETTRRFFGLT